MHELHTPDHLTANTCKNMAIFGAGGALVDHSPTSKVFERAEKVGDRICLEDCRDVEFALLKPLRQIFTFNSVAAATRLE